MRDFMRKENRDKAFKEMIEQGITNIRKCSISNQLMHPMYIEDWPYPLSQADKGFGNTIYQTHFSKIYSIRTK
jgi:hypothetical protein